MNDIAALSFEPFLAMPFGLEVSGDPPYELWEAYGAALAVVDVALPWIVGDWLNFGQATYGEKYAQALTKWPDRKLQTLMNYAYVSRHVPISRRREDVSFSVHAEVASLPPGEQESMLREAGESDLTVAEVRDRIRPVDGVEKLIAHEWEGLAARDLLADLIQLFGVRALREAIRRLVE